MEEQRDIKGNRIQNRRPGTACGAATTHQKRPSRKRSQNGRHERMHLTLKKEATKPAAANFLQQQARFEKFIEVFNNERPHEALDMKCPAAVTNLPRV